MQMTFAWLYTRAFESGSYRTVSGLPASLPSTQYRNHSFFNLKTLNALNLKIKRCGVIVVKREDG